MLEGGEGAQGHGGVLDDEERGRVDVEGEEEGVGELGVGAAVGGGGFEVDCGWGGVGREGVEGLLDLVEDFGLGKVEDLGVEGVVDWVGGHGVV